jgi:hypothetical protein
LGVENVKAHLVILLKVIPLIIEVRVDLVERLPVLIAERDVKVLTLLVVQFAVFVVVAAIKEFLDLFFVVDCRVETKLES